MDIVKLFIKLLFGAVYAAVRERQKADRPMRRTRKYPVVRLGSNDLTLQ